MVAWQKDRRTKYLYNRFSYITISRLLLYVIRYANKIFYNHHHRGKYFIIYFCLIWLLHIFSLIKWIQIFWLFWLTSRFYSKQKKNSLNIFTYLVLKVLTWLNFFVPTQLKLQGTHLTVHNVYKVAFKGLLMFIPKFYSIIVPLSTYLIE